MYEVQRSKKQEARNKRQKTQEEETRSKKKSQE
jgi:hypothetical protein